MKLMRVSMFKITGIGCAVLVALISVPAQVRRVEVAQKRESDGFSSWWYVLILVMSIALVAVVLELLKRRKSEKRAAAKAEKKRLLEKREADSIDADRELAWARKKSKIQSRKSKKRAPLEGVREISPAVYEISAAEIETVSPAENKKSEPDLPPPVFEIKRIERARPYLELPFSNDEVLLDAIEQVNEEFEEDAEIRELALKVLTAFRTQNSVEAISQVALYDLSSNLRSKAVSILADFDHESVFETILLACADPTREVRAAAARGLFHLSFERKEAWLRISELEAGRRRQCARALIAAELVERSLERLMHPDRNYSSEAFAVAVLLLKSGETDEIFQMLENHADENLTKAILHVMALAAEPAILEELARRRENGNFTAEIDAEIDKILATAEAAACV